MLLVVTKRYFLHNIHHYHHYVTCCNYKLDNYGMAKVFLPWYSWDFHYANSCEVYRVLQNWSFLMWLLKIILTFDWGLSSWYFVQCIIGDYWHKMDMIPKITTAPIWIQILFYFLHSKAKWRVWHIFANVCRTLIFIIAWCYSAELELGWVYRHSYKMTHHSYAYKIQS